MEWDERAEGELAYDEPDETEEPTVDSEPYAPPPKKSGPSPFVVILLVLLAAGLGIAAWWFLGRDTEPEPPPPVVFEERGPTDPLSPEPHDEETLDLPPLSTSDAFIRDVARRLSEHPRLVQWLAHEDLVRRFVVSVDTVARGEVPREQLEFLKPKENFKVQRTEDGRWLADPTNPSRFDFVWEVVDSIEPEVAAKLYRQLEPLFEEAYREIGRPGTTFQERMQLAIERIEAVEYPEGPLEVDTVDGNFVFVDPRYEEASDLEKQLWRLDWPPTKHLLVALENISRPRTIEPNTGPSSRSIDATDR